MDGEKIGFLQLRLKGKDLSLHKSVVRPDFSSKTVLVTDTWEYVTMWLKREGREDALFYWDQARSFFDASRNLPNPSAPLTLYYCFLNAVKTLLTLHRISAKKHGMSGKTTGRKTSLENEHVTMHPGGVLAALRTYLGEPSGNMTFSLKDLLYNLAYIHRAYTLTFTSRPELFIPLVRPRFVRQKGSDEAWFCAELEPRFATKVTVNKLKDYERDPCVKSSFTIRLKQKFKWKRSPGQENQNLQTLTNYHRKIRGSVSYIHGPTRLWYVKRSGTKGLINLSSLTITLAAMHRLSELARYEPASLSNHFECQHNWLLSEFVATARNQFIDEISSEISGQEFMIPGRKSVS
jgi:hypothetical protein